MWHTSPFAPPTSVNFAKPPPRTSPPKSPHPLIPQLVDVPRPYANQSEPRQAMITRAQLNSSNRAAVAAYPLGPLIESGGGFRLVFLGGRGPRQLHRSRTPRGTRSALSFTPRPISRRPGLTP